jgi:hypothetical protein
MDYITYHIKSSEMMDIDPANDCLIYISDRFELTLEQRYWIAFLYSTCYCAPTVFYMYNEFPDFENVDTGRLQRWWDKNKSRCVFQTDRLKIKTMNKFVETYNSYHSLIGNTTQRKFFSRLRTDTDAGNYKNAYRELGNIRNVGRFTLFIYLEMISVLTDFKCKPDTIDWKYADNCRIGLNMHLGHNDDLSYLALDLEIHRLEQYLKDKCKYNNIFNIETTLCAYKKFRYGKRYIGYYLDRQEREIERMKENVQSGVEWKVLDQFRKETYPHLYKSPTLNLFGF